MVRVYYKLRKGQENTGTYGVSGKGPSLRLNDFSRVLTKPLNLSSLPDPSQVRSKNMCHLHDYPQQSFLVKHSQARGYEPGGGGLLALGSSTPMLGRIGSYFCIF